jgi:hypothetical protein
MITIRDKKFYKPREIAKLVLIQNSSGSNNEVSNYNFILQLIKSGQLVGRNYSTSEKIKYWLVSEEEIDKYNQKFFDKLSIH